MEKQWFTIFDGLPKPLQTAKFELLDGYILLGHIFTANGKYGRSAGHLFVTENDTGGMYEIGVIKRWTLDL